MLRESQETIFINKYGQGLIKPFGGERAWHVTYVDGEILHVTKNGFLTSYEILFDGLSAV